MKVIILGAGQVGSSLASLLIKEGVDITIVDNNPAKLKSLAEKYDIRTIVGNASLPRVLRESGAEGADLLIAATSSDEVNLTACQIAYHLFEVKTRIARVREADYSNEMEIFNDQQMAVSVMINPEYLLTEYIHSTISYPSALEVMDFADGRLKLVAIQALNDGPLVHQEVRALSEHIPDIDTRVAAIYRNRKAIIADGDTVIEPGDEVFFLAEPQHMSEVMSELRRVKSDNKRIMIAGGGHIGEKLALTLQKKHKVKIIESSDERCYDLTNLLSKTVVLKGSCVNRSLLVEESVKNCDIFCAVTNNDETNIMSCLLAKNCGAKKTIALVNNADYENIFLDDDEKSLVIDTIIEPQQITISSILSFVRQGDIVRVHSLRYGAAEAIEVIAHSDSGASKIVGKKIEDINLPSGVSMAALVRGDDVLMAHRHLVVEELDHLIFFVIDKSSIEAVEKLVLS